MQVYEVYKTKTNSRAGCKLSRFSFLHLWRLDQLGLMRKCQGNKTTTMG